MGWREWACLVCMFGILLCPLAAGSYIVYRTVQFFNDRRIRGR